MSLRKSAPRIVYSFPHPLGTGRIADTAWYLVNGVADAGGDVTVFAASNHKPLRSSVKFEPTLSRGRFRMPYKVIGSLRAFALHDLIVSRRIEKRAGEIDLIHAWPLASRRTLQTAARLGIPTVLERPNAHSRFAYEVVARECERLGIVLPPGSEHAFNPEVLRIEEEEYRLATKLLCPSDFVLRTFLNYGFERESLVRHQYGYDENLYHPGDGNRKDTSGLTILFVGVCAVRKGLHYALEAWLRSPAHKAGKFLIAGKFLPAYLEKLSPMLSHPSVQVLGHRNDVADLMRHSDVLVLPTIEEGSALVTSEARGSGAVLVVSDAAGAICTHLENALVHPVGDVDALTRHITMLHEDRSLLARLRAASLSTAPQITWTAGGAKLYQIYRDVLETHSRHLSPAISA